MKIKKKIITFLVIIFIIPVSLFLYYYIKNESYDKEKAMKLWDERMEVYVKNKDTLKNDTLKVKSDNSPLFEE